MVRQTEFSVSFQGEKGERGPPGYVSLHFFYDCCKDHEFKQLPADVTTYPFS